MIRLITNTKLFSVLMEAESPILRTGLKVKNSLSGKLVDLLSFRKSSYQQKETLSDGIHADPQSTLTAILATPGNQPLTQKLCLQ